MLCILSGLPGAKGEAGFPGRDGGAGLPGIKGDRGLNVVIQVLRELKVLLVFQVKRQHFVFHLPIIISFMSK